MGNRALDNPNKKIASLPYTFFIGVLFIYVVVMNVELIQMSTNLLYSFSTTLLAIGLIFLYLQKFDYKSIMLLCVFALFIFISSAVNGSGREYMCNVFFFICLILLNTRLKLTRDAISLYYIMLISLGVILFFFAPLGHMKSALIPNDLLIKINPNTSAFLMTMLYFVSLCFYFLDKGRRKIRYLLVALFAAISIVMYAARTSLLGILLFTFLILLFKYIKLSRKSNILLILFILGVVFAYLYSIVLYDNIGPGKIVILGKDIFTGREIIWRAAFNQLKGNYFFGIGNSIGDAGENGTFTYNLHSQPMAVLTIFGLPVLILFAICYTNFMNKITSEKNFYHMILAFGIVLTLMCYTETFMQTLRNVVLIGIALAMIITKHDNVYEGVKNVKYNYSCL